MTEGLTEESEHGMRLKFDYELVANENAYESVTNMNYHSYLGVAYGKDLDEVRLILFLHEMPQLDY